MSSPPFRHQPGTFLGAFDDARIFGSPIDSRFGPTREMLGATVNFAAGAMVSRSRIKYSIGWMELLQLLGGVYDPDAIARVAPNANLELFTAKMAYGPRIVDQVEPLLAHLTAHPLSRQAVLFVAKPEDGPTNDQPCTTTIQVLVRDGLLHVIVSMRSWDLVKGMAYDVMMFGGLTMALARCLNLAAGRVTVHAGSAHIYSAERTLAPNFMEPLFVLDHEVPRQWPQLREWALANIASSSIGTVPTGVSVDWKGLR